MPMRIGTEMPALDGATEWFGGNSGSRRSRSERPSDARSFLVRQLRDLQRQLAADRDSGVMRYRNQGLRVIAVHMPRYEADTDVEAVREAIANFNIK